MSIHGIRKGLDSHQLLRRKESLTKICEYLELKYCLVPLADFRRDLGISPNVLHRSLAILTKNETILEYHSEKTEPKKGRRRFFVLKKNLPAVQYLEDRKNLDKQKKQNRTNRDYEVLKSMIRLNESTMTKNQVAKMFGLKSPKSFEHRIRKYPTLMTFREMYRRSKEERIGYIDTMFGPFYVKIPNEKNQHLSCDIFPECQLFV